MAIRKSRLPAALSAAIFAAALLAIGGCASQKEPAEQALAAIEKTFGESGAQIQKYIPDRHKELSDRIAALREALAKEDYGDVVSDAVSVTDDLRRSVADARIKGAQEKAAMQEEWSQLVATMPGMIAAVDKKLASQGSKLPQGMDRVAFRALVDSYDAARDAWGKAATGMTTATFEASVLAAREAKTTIAGVMQTLGVTAS